MLKEVSAGRSGTRSHGARLIVIHIVERGPRSRLLAASRFLAAGKKNAPVDRFLVLGAPGDGDQLQRTFGPQALTPSELLTPSDVDRVNLETYRVSIAIGSQLVSPPHVDFPVGDVHYVSIQNWVNRLLMDREVLLLALQSVGLDRCIILTSHLTHGRLLANDLRRANVQVQLRGIPDLPFSLPPTDNSGPRVVRIEDPMAREGVLLVSESPPMDLMFERVEDALPANILSLISRVTYTAPPHRSRVGLVRVSPPQGTGSASSGSGRVRLASVPSRIPALINESLPQLCKMIDRRHLPLQVSFVPHVHEILDHLHPVVVVVGNDRHWTGQLWVRIAKSRGVATMCLQDGVAADNPSWFTASSDWLGASSELWPRLLASRGTTPSVVRVVGQPRNDSLMVPGLAGVGIGPQRGNSIGLLALQAIHGGDYLSAILEALRGVQGLRLIIRPHPALPIMEMEDIIHAHGNEYASLEYGISVVDQLAACDFVITEYSTVALEAVLLGKPVVSVTLSGQVNKLPLGDMGLALEARTRTELLLAVLAIMNDRGVRRTPQVSERGIRELIGPADGAAGTRAASMITELFQIQTTRRFGSTDGESE